MSLLSDASGLMGGGGAMNPMGFSASSSATATATGTNASGATSGTVDAGTSSKAAKIYNITMGHGNIPNNTSSLAQSDSTTGALSWQKIALYGILALAAIFIVRSFRE